MNERPDIRLAVICSSGGGLLEALCRSRDAPGIDFDVAGAVLDRPCAAADVARAHRIPHTLVDDADRDAFTNRAATTIAGWGATHVLLLMLRCVGPGIWRDLPAEVWNLHPSLLPDYSGLDALRRSYDAGAEHLGVTLHHAIAEADAGPAIAQGRFARAHAPTLDAAGHLCFLLKVMLTLDALASTGATRTPATAQADLEDQPWDGAFRPHAPAPAVLAAAAPLARPWARRWLHSLEGAAVP